MSKLLLSTFCLVVGASSCDSCVRDAELAEQAADAMNIISTKVAPTRGLRVAAVDFVRASDGRMFLANGWNGATQMVDQTGKLSSLPLECISLARDGHGNVFCAPRTGIVKILPSGRVVELAHEVEEPCGACSFQSLRLSSDKAGNVYFQAGALPIVSIGRITSRGHVERLFRAKTVSEKSNSWGWRNFAVDERGNMYFGADGAVLELSSDGEVKALAGSESGTSRSTDRKDVLLPNLWYIHDVRVDGRGNVYVMQFDGTILRIAPNGNITVALQSGCRIVGAVAQHAAGCTAGLVDGPLDHQLIGISAFDIDDDGNIYFVDKGSNSLRKATPAGMLSTIIRGEFPTHM